jgi:type IV pilus assembly protein PilA
MSRERGFTIIEVMIVMTIIGILAALCIPLYQSYVARSKIAEAFMLADPVKLAISEQYVQSGAFPADNTAAEFGAPATLRGRYVGSIAIAAGVVLVTYADPTLAGQTVTFTPTAAGNLVTWACTSSLPEHLRPRGCP